MTRTTTAITPRFLAHHSGCSMICSLQHFVFQSCIGHILVSFFFFCSFHLSLSFFFFFFFSSRRRHTRSLRDWSSDVCSSDLVDSAFSFAAAIAIMRTSFFSLSRSLRRNWLDICVTPADEPASISAASLQIGRASCRERVEISVVAGGLNKERGW